MARAPIATGLAQLRSRPLNASRLVNFYAEVPPPGSRAKLVLYGTPGQKEFLTIGGDTIRAGIEAQGYAYVLSGSTLYRVDSAGVAQACTGDLIPTTGAATLVNNGVQVGLLVRPDWFSITGTVVTKVVSGSPDAGFSSVAYIGSYAVLTVDDTSGQFYITAPLDFGSIDPLDYATAESSPDGLTGVLVDHRETWLFGVETTEVWSLTGASPFPFEPVLGALLERGCAAARSPAKMDNSVFWLGNDRIVYRADGYQPVRVSTFAIEEIIRTGTVSDAFGMTYAMAGHHFYVLTFPSLGRTFCYDAATNLWHERQTGTGLTPAAWNVGCLFSAFGKTLVGLQAGKVAELDLDTYSDLGEPIRSVATTLPIYPNGRRAILSDLELELELGVGIGSGQGSDPEVMMRFSDDGAATWSNERRATIGRTGNRRVRANWHRLGAFRERTIEFSISDPVKRALYGINAAIEELAN